MKKQLSGEAWILSAEKRRQDIRRAVSLLPLIAPLAGIGMASVYAENGHAPLFHQTRIGQYGRPFEMYKIRTMPSTNYFDSSGGHSDERATPVGRVLRRLIVDETPQVINIFRREMSFIAPRALIRPDIDNMREVLSPSQFKEWFRDYTLGLPGVFSSFGNISRYIQLGTPAAYMLRAELDVWDVEMASKAHDDEIWRTVLQIGKSLLSRTPAQPVAAEVVGPTELA